MSDSGTAPAGLHLTPSEGPPNPSGSTPRVGLFPGAPVLAYEFTGLGAAELATPFVVEEGTVFRVGLWPELQFDPGEPDRLPNHCSAAIGLVARTADTDFELRDQHHLVVAAGHAGARVSDQWNLVDLDLSPLAGQTISIIATSPSGHGRGWVQAVGVVPAPQAAVDPLDLVRTTRGTHQTGGGSLSRGNTYPLTALPHGFAFLTPVTDARSHRWLYSWHGAPTDPDPRPALQALAVTHCASPWMGDRAAFQVMGWTGTPTIDPLARQRHFDHAEEVDRAHHYRVRLEDGVVAEMAPASRAACFRFDFTACRQVARGVVLDQPGDGDLHVTLLADGRASFTAFIKAPTDWELDGLPGLPGYVYGETRQPVEVVAASSREGIPELPGNLGRTITRHWPSWLRLPVRRQQAGALRLAQGEDHLEVVVGLSFISTQQAHHNLQLEIAGKGFDEVREAAGAAWAALLGRLEITGGTHDQRVSAYSNLARLHAWPNEHHENLAGPGDDPHWAYASPLRPGAKQTQRNHIQRNHIQRHHIQRHHIQRHHIQRNHIQRHHTGASVVGGQLMVNNGFWDTFRTCWPAYHLFSPVKAGELLDGIVQHYLDGGWMARWSAPGYCDIMVGTSSDAVFADASAHGLRFNEQAAYDSALRNASVPAPIDAVGRKGLQGGRFRGWIADSVPEGFSWTMDNANSDAALSRWSSRLADRCANAGDAADSAQVDPARRDEYRANARWFAHRAMSYQQLFDPGVGFFRGLNEDGAFASRTLDPTLWGGDYTETNAWGMAFHAPFDGAGLATLFGGESGLADKLKEALGTPETATPRAGGHYGGTIHEMLEARALRLGQIAISNQPAHHIPYMWTHTGQHHRTQWLTREILERCFTGSLIGQGYPGDEDNGEMSAWWLLSAAGLYPLWVGSGELVITAPLFERFAFRRDDGTLVEVRAHHIQHRYIQSVHLNGEPWHRVSLPLTLLQGRDVTLQVELGPEPSNWATDTRPASISTLVPKARWQGDLTRTAHVRRCGARGGERDSFLCDDRGEVEGLEAGATLQVSWEGPVNASIFTLTTEDLEALPAHVEVCRDGLWVPTHGQPRPALWANQTQAYVVDARAEPVAITGWRMRTSAPCRLRQVEVYP